MRALMTGIRLVLLGAVTGAPAVAQVLDPPSLRCASVNVSGDVTLTWVVPPDPNGIFQQYEVYHSASLGGPYLLVPPAIMVYGTATFTHFGAGAHLAPQYYYVVAVSSAPPPNSSAPSPPVSSTSSPWRSTVPVAEYHASASDTPG